MVDPLSQFVSAVLDDVFYFSPKPTAKPPWTVEAYNKDNGEEGISLYLALAGVSQDQVSVYHEGNLLSIDIDSTNNTYSTDKFKIKEKLRFKANERYDLANTKVHLKDGLMKLDIPLKEKKTFKNLLFGTN